MSEIDLEAVHTPHPGSSRDAVSKMNDAAQPQAAPSGNGGTRTPKPVKTTAVAAPKGIYRTMAIAAGSERQLLPQDPERARAVMVATGNVILCETQGLAQSVNNVGAATPAEVIGANPAAGAAYTYTLPAPATLLSAQYGLTTSATVANRFPEVNILDASGNVIVSVHEQTAVVASSSITIVSYQGATQGNSASGTAILPLPTGFVLPAGYQVQLTAGNLQSTDQIANPYLTFSGSPSVAYPDGFLLPSGTPLETKNQGLVWAVNPGNAAVLVSVMTERYEQA